MEAQLDDAWAVAVTIRELNNIVQVQSGRGKSVIFLMFAPKSSSIQDYADSQRSQVQYEATSDIDHLLSIQSVLLDEGTLCPTQGMTTRLGISRQAEPQAESNGLRHTVK